MTLTSSISREEQVDPAVTAVEGEPELETLWNETAKGANRKI
jgi:hypothetical protein